MAKGAKRMAIYRTPLLIAGVLFVFCAAAHAAETRPISEWSGQTRPNQNLTMSCTSAGSSPACAFKSWAACVLYRAPALCDQISAPIGGDGGSKPTTLDQEVLARPWSQSFEHVMPEAFGVILYDGGIVPSTRFEGGSGTLAASPGGDIAELVADVADLDAKDVTFSWSFFFRRDQGRWTFVGWHSTRPKACSPPAQWDACRWYIDGIKPRSLAKLPTLWASPKLPGHDDYDHAGVDLLVNAVGAPVVSPLAGTLSRRPLMYLDTANYSWAVVAGDDGHTIVKIGFVDGNGPAAGAKLSAGQLVGHQQTLQTEYPGISNFVHLEMLLDGRHVDPTPLLGPPKK
jgi:hypothetical protein